MQQGPLGNKKLCVDLRQSLYSLINLFKNQASVAQSRNLLLGVESWAVSSGSLCYHLQLDKAEWGPPSARAVILGQFPILQRQCLWDLAEITELGQALSSLDHHRWAISSSFEGRPNRWCLELGHQVPAIYTLFRDIEITTSGTKTRAMSGCLQGVIFGRRTMESRTMVLSTCIFFNCLTMCIHLIFRLI